MNRIFVTIALSLLSLCISAQEKITIEEYIEQYKDLAISEMKRTGVPAAITLAQGLHETENGNSDLVKRSNNHFGIKCKSSWTGEKVYHDDDARGECFRSYVKAEDSYRDHSDYLRSNTRYDFLFKLDPADYKGWAYGIKRAGYATNPRYPQILIKNIEQYNLQQYSLIAMNGSPEAGKEEEKTIAVAKEDKAVDAPAAVNTDPGKVILINGTKCVFANKGTSMLAIAMKNNISLSKLMEFNDTEEEGILNRDQYIYLHKKPKSAEREYCIVQPGETLYDIAQKNGIQLKSLKEYNDLKDHSAVAAGDKLFLRSPSEEAKANANSAKMKIKTHTVEPKEGLYSIAKKYRVTVKQLREWNNLDSNELHVGQELIVSK